MKRLSGFLTPVLLLTLAACSGQDGNGAKQGGTAGPTLDFGVVETFETGNNVYVRSMDIDKKQGRLWVGTTVGALEVDLASRNMAATYTRDQGLANEYIFAIKADSEGGKWFGTNGGGISRLQDGKWHTYFPMHGLADYWVYAFTEDKTGQLWIGTWAGLNVMNRKDGSFKTYVKELVNEWVYGLDVDSRNRIWIGTEGGVNMFDGKTWSTWTHKEGLGAANLDKLPVSENTGLGTRDRHDLSVMLQGGPTYNPNYVFSLRVDSKDHVWAGTWGGGASYFDGQKWNNYTARDGLAANIVYSVAVDDKDHVWLGTSGGLSYFDGKRWQTLTREHGLLDNNVYAVAVALNGDVWVGTRGGVALVQRLGTAPAAN